MFLCDTNVVSELARPQPNEGVLRWVAAVGRLNVSVVTLEEVLFGLTWRPNPRVRAWFEGFVTTSCDALPVTAEIARLAGELRGNLAQGGRPRTQADMLIAATAHLHRLVLVTRNRRDFEGCPVTVLDPFS